MSLDIGEFISEVEKRPALYNVKLKEYSDKILKKNLWLEIFEKLIENWSELGMAEKEAKGQELQKKWKNLRTCFKREYGTQTKQPTGSGAKKRRKYFYFDQLLFLRDSLECRQTSSSLENTSNAEDVSGDSETEEARDINPPNIVVKPRKRKGAQKSFDDRLLAILEKKREEDGKIDEDKFFLLSLVPAFKKFNEDQKFMARTEIMNAMRRVRLSGNTPQNPSGFQHGNQSIGNSSQANTAQYFPNFVPEEPLSPSQSAASPMMQDSWENASEGSYLYRL